MGDKLAGDDARIWELHSQGVCVASISVLVGLPADRVRGVIVGAWLDDKVGAKGAGKA